MSPLDYPAVSTIVGQATADPVFAGSAVAVFVVMSWSLEESTFVEHRAGTDQADQWWRVDGSPAGLRGLDQLAGRRNPGGS